MRKPPRPSWRSEAPLHAELEITEDEERRVEIEAKLSAILEQWELDRGIGRASGPAGVLCADELVR